MKRFILSCAIFLAGCSIVPSNGLKYENIKLPVPVPEEGWTMRSGDVGKNSIASWIKENNQFEMTIMRGGKPDAPEKFQTGMDSAARGFVAPGFQSKVLKQGTVNNYPMILWETEATLTNGTKLVNLFLYISGNDAGYWLHRRWRNLSVPDADKQRWIDYLESVSVCDTRSADHPCGDMKKVVPVDKSTPW